jgi:hypothetical protein
MVSRMPTVCAKKANIIILLGPTVWYTRPPIIMAMGKPKNHIELMKPSCSADSPKSLPNWGKIPARILKEKAVVIKAKQLA